MRRTIVILAAGAALSVVGCNGRAQPTVNPPPPEVPTAPAPDSLEPVIVNPNGPIRTSNPPPPQLPPPLLEWGAVASNHPEGSTNPPIPVLAINADGSECFKEWYDPRVVPQAARESGGRILTEGEVSEGTPVQCPQERVDTLLGR